MRQAVRRLGGQTAALAGAAVLLTAYPPNRLTTQARLWSPDDRVLLSDFSFVTALAATADYVFAATRHGLIVYDRRARAWQHPVTVLEGYPASRVLAAFSGPYDRGVWLGLDDGYARYDLDTRQWQRGVVAGGVYDFAMDLRSPAQGVFMRTRLGWRLVGGPIGGLVQPRDPPPPAQRIGTLDPQAALTQSPTVDAFRALILTDPRLRAYQFTSAARTPDQNDVFFGTSGMGVVRVDPQTGEWDALAYGLVAAGVGAIATGPGGGVWAASAARVGERRGLTWVAADLSQTRTTESGGAALGFAFLQARRLIARGKDLWLATERGLYRIDNSTYRNRLFDAGQRGLPSEDVTSIVPAPDGVWVGTARGLAVCTDREQVVRVGAFAQPVLSLLAVRETLWVGSVAGLGMLAPGDTTVAAPPELLQTAYLREPIVALARMRDTIVAATPAHLVWRDAATRKWTALDVTPGLGVVTAVAADDGGVWVGGTQGLAWADLGRGHARLFLVPGDVPAAVRDVAVDADYLWVATDSGLVRFARSALRP